MINVAHKAHRLIRRNPDTALLTKPDANEEALNVATNRLMNCRMRCTTGSHGKAWTAECGMTRFGDTNFIW
ncbi:hypothetical protein PAXRUDRAFT_822028 [Paxillus rubicundulus Ve08.2h10]|uniref:Uncharacterized protein n=1 Tax=Paxillus rubicundulus Ve08.2h10 TaxID=930991 RepID=A0A0D0DMR1_9AGAM|nr:hypothetical protein PAXRUDRAFT_822028 [Paxillus rubicundulus Ve08.2h10]